MGNGSYGRNAEGYTDYTAALAIQRVTKTERKNAMAKKRSCRRTEDESAIHEKAVKLRKMTDAQLVGYMEKQKEAARKEGISQGKGKPVDIDAIVNEIGNLKGVGIVKLKYIREILVRRLEGGEPQ